MNKPDTRAVAIGGLVGLVGAAIGLGAGLSLGAVPGGIVGAIAAAAIGAAAGARLLGEPATRGAHSASPFAEGPGPQRGVPATGGHLATRTFAPPGLPDDDHDSEAIRASAREIADAAMGLDESSRRMAEGASDQTGTVTRTTNTVEALSDRIDRISQNAEEAADATQGTRQQAVRGLEQIRGIIQGMDGLRSLVEANARKARRLGERSVEIGAIVRMIDEISSRTDMLALNATIESVRAGEHGRGFAVVAEEIRKLAERSAAATREIGTLVEAIQADAHESVRALAVEEAQMEEETRRVHEAGSALERIHRMAEDSARLVDGISHSANDQVLAARDLVAGMQRIAEVANQTLGETAQIRHETRLLVSLCERVHGLGAGPKPGMSGGPGRGRRPIAAEATP